MYIAIDLEFNQSFDFPDGDITPINRECQFEIIQLGLVKLDEKLKIIDRMNILVKPCIYPRIHPYVARLTRLNNESFKDAGSFKDAYDKFIKFLGVDDVFLVWGSGDLSALYRNMRYYKLDSEKVSRKFVNVQKLTSVHLKCSDKQAIGLKKAIELLELPQETSFHDALNDAVYTAEIFNVVKGDINLIRVDEYKSKSESKKKNERQVDFSKLYVSVQKDLGRSLSKREKYVIRTVYNQGKLHKFG